MAMMDSSHSKDSAVPEQSFTVLLPLNCVDQPINFWLSQNAFLNCIAIGANLACHSLQIRHAHDFKVGHKRPMFTSHLA